MNSGEAFDARLAELLRHDGNFGGRETQSTSEEAVADNWQEDEAECAPEAVVPRPESSYSEQPQNEAHEGKVIFSASTYTHMSESLQRRRNRRESIKRNGNKFLFGACVVGIALTVQNCTGNNSPTTNGANMVTALLPGNDPALKDGYELQPYDNTPFVSADITSSADLYYGVRVLENTEDPSSEQNYFISNDDTVTGERSFFDESFQFSEVPFSDEGDTTSRAPIWKIDNRLLLGLDTQQMSIQQSSSDADVVEVPRSSVSVTAYMPGVSDAAASKDAFVGYESFGDPRSLFSDERVTDDAIESLELTMTGGEDSETNPDIINAMRIETLEGLQEQDCYTNIVEVLDAELIDHVESGLEASLGRKVTAILTGSYVGPDVWQREVFGDTQPTVDGEGDETRFTGEFMLGDADVDCQDVERADLFQQSANEDANKGGKS